MADQCKWVDDVVGEQVRVWYSFYDAESGRVSRYVDGCCVGLVIGSVVMLQLKDMELQYILWNSLERLQIARGSGLTLASAIKEIKVRKPAEKQMKVEGSA